MPVPPPRANGDSRRAGDYCGVAIQPRSIAMSKIYHIAVKVLDLEKAKVF